MKLGHRLHILKFGIQFLFFEFLVFKFLSVEFHVQLLQLRVNHVWWYIRRVLLDFDYLLAVQAIRRRQVCQLEKLYLLQSLVATPLYSFTLLNPRLYLAELRLNCGVKAWIGLRWVLALIFKVYEVLLQIHFGLFRWLLLERILNQVVLWRVRGWFRKLWSCVFSFLPLAV